MNQWSVKVVYILEGVRYEDQMVVGDTGRDQIERFLERRARGEKAEYGEMVYFEGADRGLHGYKTNQIIVINMKAV